MGTNVGQGDTFGALLRRYRQHALLCQEQLAERARLSVDAVSALERGKWGTPRPNTVALLVRALALSAEDRAAFIAAAHHSWTALDTESSPLPATAPTLPP